MRPFKPYSFPSWLAFFFKPALFHYPNESKRIFLTFDDGPTPQVTEFVLDLLKQYDMRATFFVVGDKIEKHLDILNRARSEGHSIANHTYFHTVYNRNSEPDYLSEIAKTQDLLDGYGLSTKRFFRPPHGRISRSLIKKLHQSGYRTVMWKLLSWDFDPTINPLHSLQKLKRRTRPGHIVVFHDSKKAYSSLKIILPPYLAFLKEKGWRSEVLQAL